MYLILALLAFLSSSEFAGASRLSYKFQKLAFNMSSVHIASRALGSGKQRRRALPIGASKATILVGFPVLAAPAAL